MILLPWLLVHVHGALAFSKETVASTEVCRAKRGKTLMQVSQFFELASKTSAKKKYESKDRLKTHLLSLAATKAKKEGSAAGCPLAFSSSVKRKLAATPLNESGFESIKQLCCPIYMKEFVRRLIKDHWQQDICLEGGLSGITIWFQCNDQKGSGNDWSRLLNATAPGSDARHGDCPFIGIPPNCPPLVSCDSFPDATMPPCQQTTSSTTIALAPTCAGYSCPAGFTSVPAPHKILCTDGLNSCTMTECCDVDPSQCGGTPQVACSTPTTHFWDISKAHVIFMTANVDCCSARGTCAGFSCFPGFEVKATTYCPGPMQECDHDVCCQLLPGVSTTTTTTTTVTKLATTTLTTTCWAGVVGDVEDDRIRGACGVSLTSRQEYVLVIGRRARTAALIDVSVKAAPIVRSHFEFRGQPDCAAVCDGNYAYILEQHHKKKKIFLVIIDISSPLELVRVAEVRLAGYGTVAAKSGKYLYITHNNYHNTKDNRDVSVVDVSDHSAPAVIGRHRSAVYGAYGGYIYGDHLYMAVRFRPGLAVLNVSNKLSPRLLSMYSDSGLKGAMWIAVKGNTAYLSGDYCQCMRAYDVSDPAHPKFVGSAVDPNSIGAIVASGNYIVEHGHNLLVWDVSSAKPKKALDFFDKAYMAHGGASGVAVQYNHVFWMSKHKGMQVIDVSCLPKAPSLPSQPFE